MRRVLLPAMAVLTVATGLQGQTAPDASELTSLLKEFLAGASVNDAAMHDRFWADDLIYTGSSGRRMGKPDIMHDVRSAPAPRPGEPKTTYSAEDVRIQQQGDTAVVAFRLIGATEKAGQTQVTSYLNSGSFFKRNGTWKVVSWQATRIPRPQEDAKIEVAAAQIAFHQAMRGADVKALEELVDPSFIWTHRSGEQMTRQQLLDQLGSGELKYSKLDTNNMTVALYGDAAVVRGVFYTLTFVNEGGAWKAVALHTSGPEGS